MEQKDQLGSEKVSFPSLRFEVAFARLIVQALQGSQEEIPWGKMRALFSMARPASSPRDVAKEAALGDFLQTLALVYADGDPVKAKNLLGDVDQLPDPLLGNPEYVTRLREQLNHLKARD
jgi:hypothetical protein